MVVFGGGHNSYFGSSVHSFDLASRQWRRLTDGYVSGTPNAYGEGAVYPNAVYPDGSPLPPHTYDYVQYDEQGNDYILLKGQTELGPNVKAVAIPLLFNLNTLTWRRGPQHPAAILNSGGFTTWDATRRYLWGHSGDAGGGNCFVAYCPDGMNADGTFGSWQAFQPNKMAGNADHNSMQIEPDADVIVVAAHAQNTLYTIRPDEPARAPREIHSTGDMPKLMQYAALEYSTKLRKLVYYASTDRAQVHVISLDKVARWENITSVQSLDPIEHARAATNHRPSIEHTFGRFRIASYESCDVAILLRHVDSPVYAFLLPDLED
jgi:hypothetical protein